MSSQYEKRKMKAKKKVVKKTVKPEVEVTYDRTAYDVFRDGDTSKFMIAEVEYDSVTKQARVKEVKYFADSQPVANYKIKELYAKKLIMGRD